MLIVNFYRNVYKNISVLFLWILGKNIFKIWWDSKHQSLLKNWNFNTWNTFKCMHHIQASRTTKMVRLFGPPCIRARYRHLQHWNHVTFFSFVWIFSFDFNKRWFDLLLKMTDWLDCDSRLTDCRRLKFTR